MLRNYLRAGWQIFSKNKGFTIINTLGFALALAVVLLIFLYIRYEKSFEQHLPHRDQIHRIIVQGMDVRGMSYHPATPNSLGKALSKQLPGNSQVASVLVSKNKTLQANGRSLMVEQMMLFVDSGFCELFNVRILRGDPASLNQAHTAFITPKLARQFFKHQDPMGRELVLANNLHLTVKGLIEAPPPATHLPYQILISAHSLSNDYSRVKYNPWALARDYTATYIRLDSPQQKESTEQTINRIGQSFFREKQIKLLLQPIDEIHLDDRLSRLTWHYTNSQGTIGIFTTISLMILIIAGINFVNLSVVQAIRRTREIGMRKIVGASNARLIRQLLTETFFILAAAVALAMLFVELSLPLINKKMEPLIHLDFHIDRTNLLYLAAVLVLLVLLAGLFHLSYISKYKPLEALRKNFYVRTAKKRPSRFKVLVIFQFMITQVLLIGFLVINSQLQYLHSKDLGFETENVILVRLPGQDTLQRTAFKKRLEQHQAVDRVSVSSELPMDPSGVAFYSIQSPINGQFYEVCIKVVDRYFTELFDVQMKNGRWFPLEQNNSLDQSIVVNETFIATFGFSSPESAIHQSIEIEGNQYRIIGVARDFHVFSLHRELQPTILFHHQQARVQEQSKPIDHISIKLNQPDPRKWLPFIRQSYGCHLPEEPFVYQIYEDEVYRQYQQEDRSFMILGTFTIIAIILASMGLFGLVSFVMAQKTRETGIRKANGATGQSIIAMYLFRYLKITVIGSLLAWPFAYFFMHQWLTNYAYHADLSLRHFLMGLLILLGVALFSILFQTIRTANTNPAASLRED